MVVIAHVVFLHNACVGFGGFDGYTAQFQQLDHGCRDGGEPFKITYTGKVSADHIDFSRDAGRGAPVTFTAKKQ